MSPRGGVRPGAGRPPSVGAKAAGRTVRVRIADEHAAALQTLAARWGIAGNDSEVVRRALLECLRGLIPAKKEGER